MKRISKVKIASLSPSQLAKQIKKFEKENPLIVKALDTLDISMAQYQETIRSIEPIKIQTSNSTKVLL